jgi:hypothetical protein
MLLRATFSFASSEVTLACPACEQEAPVDRADGEVVLAAVVAAFVAAHASCAKRVPA